MHLLIVAYKSKVMLKNSIKRQKIFNLMINNVLNDAKTFTVIKMQSLPAALLTNVTLENN